VSHPHPLPSAENPWAGQGSVLLDLGGGVGALVVEMPREMTGTEVEVRPVRRPRGPDRHAPHVAVVARPVGSGSVPSLVFPELRAGDYRLSVKGSDLVAMTVQVSGGRVTDARWPRTRPGGAGGEPSSARGGAG
jgi:hypothetical protein